MMSCLNAGLTGPEALGVIIPLSLACGGLMHIIVALWGFVKNELFTAIVFGTFGAFWITLSLMQYGMAMKWFEVDAKTMLVFFIAWTIFTFYIWVASLVTNKAVITVVSLLLLTFIFLDLGMAQLAGYAGILSALAGFYTSAAGVINTLYGREILPVGPVSRS